MPNHVTNKLFVVGDKKKAQDLFELIDRDNSDQVIDFNKIIATPDNIFQGDLGTEERKKYGKNNWYDWNCENWGTKWNAYDSVKKSDRSIEFTTAWNGVLNLMVELSKKCPNVLLYYSFADADFGSNVGVYSIKNGKVINKYIPESESYEAKYLASVVLGYYWDEEIGESYDV